MAITKKSLLGNSATKSRHCKDCHGHCQQPNCNQQDGSSDARYLRETGHRKAGERETHQRETGERQEDCLAPWDW